MKEPNIRFKGFRGEWKTSIIGDIATFSKGRGYSKSDLRSEGNPIVLYGRLYTNYSSVIESVDTFASLQNGSVLTKGNEVIIPGSGETPEDIAVASAVEQKGVILGGDLNVLTFDQEKISPAFAAMSITYSNTHNELSGYAQGKTVVHLHNSSISKGHISYPYIDEQQSISTYFQHLDSLIQSTTKKIESLKQVKAASLQSMFPQEGETTPRVRFKGFEGEWEKKTLGDCLTINNERNQSNVYGINDVLSVSDEVGVVNQIKLLGRSYAGKSVVNYRVLKTNQIVYTKSPLKSKPYGIIKVNKGDIGIVSVLYAVYDANENVYPDYIHYYFEPIHRINNYLLPLINKGAKNTMNISDEMALTGKIWIPSLEEQKKIADFLQALDSQITLQTRNYSANGITRLSVAPNRARIASNAVWPCFFVVSTIECIAKKASAPKSDLKVPEFFSFIFSFLMPRSLALLSEGIKGSSKKVKM